jgi:carbamoyl-phosphate synthase large subunit
VTRPNVLITAASRRVPLVRAFQAALREMCLTGRVIATDVNALSPAAHLADRWYEVPLSSDPQYIDTVLAICRHQHVGLVVPTIDDELVLFGQSRARFEACGVRVAVSPPQTSLVCDDKYQTAVELRAHGIAAAETRLPHQLPSDAALPLFIKPRIGRGGVGAYAVTTKRELDFFLDYVPSPVVQEFLDGPEFTIDMLCDFDGSPLAIVPRERTVIRAGVIDRGRTVRDAALMDLAASVARVLPFAGPVNVQCRVVNGRPVVFEINPRFSGGIPLTIAAGADFPAMLLQLARGRQVAPAIGAFRHDLWMSNYEEPLFLQADSTTGAMTRADVLPGVAVREVA